MKADHIKYISENLGKKPVSQIASDLNVTEIEIRKFLKKHKIGKVERVPDTKIREKMSDKKKVLLSLGLILALGFIVYAGSISGRFIYDDEILIRNNSYIKNWSYLPKIFTEDVGKGAARSYSFYRPVQMFTYLVDYSFWGLNTVGYHITNILLHILAAFCVYWFINVLFKDKTLSFLTGLFFVIHPIHTEAVAYMSGRSDMLGLLFMLICFIAYIKQDSSASAGLFCVSIITYILALLSRENTLILPVLILLYHYAFKKRLVLKRFLPLLGLALIYILLRATALKSLTSGLDHSTTIIQRLPGFFAALFSYIRLLILPVGLHMEYGAKIFRMTEPLPMIGMAMAFLLLAFALWQRKRNELAFFSTSWFLIALLPVSNIYPINAYMAEHWLYIPSIGFFLILAGGLKGLYDKKGIRAYCMIPVIGLVLFYSSLTILQNAYWKEPVAFYERTLKHEPHSVRMLDSLGGVYDDARKMEEAIKLYKRAIEITPNYDVPYNNLGLLYAQIGKTEEAIKLYKRAIELKPNADAYNNLGLVLASMGNYEEARAAYEKALELNPNFANAYNNIGLIYNSTGKAEEAIIFYKKALEVNPDYDVAYNNLGLIYGQTGKTEEALRLFRKAVEINPNYADAYNNIGTLYYKSGMKKEAVSFFKKATEVNPNHADAQYNLSLVSKEKE